MIFTLPISSRPQILLAISLDERINLTKYISDLAMWREKCDCRILAEGNIVGLNEEYGHELQRAGLSAIEPMLGSVRSLFIEILSGKLSGVDRIALVNNLAQVSSNLLQEASVVISIGGDKRFCSITDFGCTLVTSVFRSDYYLRGFIENSEKLIGYDQFIDHIFLVSKVSGLEIELLISLIMRRDNIILVWNREDPGLYNCWNIGIRIASHKYVSNANVDDLRAPEHVVTLVNDLEVRPDCHVAATALNPFYDFPEDGSLPTERAAWYADQAGQFNFFDLAHLEIGQTPSLVPHNIPHCMPVWRKSLHKHFGWFNEARYGTYADWAFWLKALKGGALGWLNPNALSFYFVNPGSHNRRGSDLQRYHEAVERDYIDYFISRKTKSIPICKHIDFSMQKKLTLLGRDYSFGVHRNNFNTLIGALEPLERTDGRGIQFIPFIERQFVWGDAPGEAASSDPRAITQPWIGILHVPFEAPRWFSFELSPESIFTTDLWKRSRPYCRGIITLARDLEADLNVADSELPTLSVLHPTAFGAAMFDLMSYQANPRVIQVGDWLRKLQAIHRLRAPGHERIMLTKQHTGHYLGREIAKFGDFLDPSVNVRYLVSNDEYDQLLSSSVVLCLLYGTAANNVVIECIARATPIIINPLPAAVEYLGRGYPLYARDEVEADSLLEDSEKVIQAHAYLLSRRSEIDLTYEGFSRAVGTSEFYIGL